MKKNNINISTNKSFGVVFCLFFLIVSIFPLLNNGNIRVWAIILAIIFLLLGLFNSSILTPLNKIWFKFGILLGNFVSPIVMGLVFFSVVTPTAIIMRILGKNLLDLKRGKKNSYWIEKSQLTSKMKNQF